MPSYRHHELGDLYLQINVNFPDTIPEAAFPLLEQALPRREDHMYPGEGHVEEVCSESLSQSTIS